jgi:hypothetical protein
MEGMVDEIKTKVTVPDLIKATVSVPEQVTGKATGEVMLDPDVNLIKVAGQPIGHATPVPVRLTDGAEYIDPRLIENPPALDVALSTRASEETVAGVKTQTDKMSFDADGALKVQNPPNLDVKLSDIETALDSVFGQLDSKTSTLAKESDGNLEAIKTQADKLLFDAQGNLKMAEQGTVTVTGDIDADVTGTVAVSGTPTVEIKNDSVGLAKEADGNLAAIKAKTDNLDAKLSDIKTGTDKIPDAPAEEHVAANDPHAVRLTDGSAFLDPRQVSIQELDALLRYMLQSGMFQTSVDSAGRLRVIIDVSGTATPVTESGTWNVGLSSGSNVIGGVTLSPYGQGMDLEQKMYLVYQGAQRDKMTFS